MFLWSFESGTLCEHTIYVHPSVRTSHTYLTMSGIPDFHLLQLPTQPNSLQHWHRVHLLHSDHPQTLQVWKGCSYNIASTLGHGKRTMVIVCSASNKLMRYSREQRSELTKECHMARIADVNFLFVLISRMNQPTHETDCKTVVYGGHLSPPSNHLQYRKYLNALAKNSFALRA